MLIGSAFVIAIGFGIVSPVLPAYARSFDVGVAAASAVVSIFAFFRLLFAPAGGALVSRLGERPVYLGGLMLVAVSSLATAGAQDYHQLLVLRGLGGIGSTMFTVSAMALLVRLAPPSMRGRVSSVYASAFLLGGMVGPLVGGALAGFGLRAPFVIYAVVLIIAAGVVALRLREAPLPDGAPRPTPADPMSLAEAWAHPTYRAGLASAFANGWCNFGVRVAVVPQFAVAVHDGPWVAGLALALAALGTALTLPRGGRMTDTVGRRPTVLLGLVVTALGLGLIGWSGSLAVLLVLSVFSGVGGGFVNPAQQAAVADVVGNERGSGRVLSVFQMAQDAGAILGPVLVGIVADQVGYGWAFALTGAVALLAALPWVTAPETRPQEPPGVEGSPSGQL